jgi:hybrid polyketide synthase/nonribosomal peptide synthetase ACE1
VWAPTLGHRIQEICLQYPEAIALSDGGDVSLTYGDLEMRAQTIRNRLSAAGVKHGDTVAVLQDSTKDWIVSIIAIFWSGAVYVPLVPKNPMPRLAAIIGASKPTAILADTSTIRLATELQLPNASVINLSLLSTEPKSTAMSVNVSAEDPALILFTSGSTGIPKGIILRHRNLAHHIEGYVKAWNIGREIVLQQSAFSFDLSVGQIFTGLSMGGTVIVVPERTRGDPSHTVRVF